MELYQEIENLKLGWNKWPYDYLLHYLARTNAHHQVALTRRILFNYLAKRSGKHSVRIVCSLRDAIDGFLLSNKKIFMAITLSFERYIFTISCINSAAVWLLKRFTPPKINFLDVGCGSANYFRNFHEYGLDTVVEYTGVDIADKNIENAKMLFPNSRFLIGNICSLEFTDESFDIVLVSHVFEHLSIISLEAALNEAMRVTKDLLIVHFFHEREIHEHIIAPFRTYYWNCLSREKLKRVFNPFFEIKIIDMYTMPEGKYGRIEGYYKDTSRGMRRIEGKYKTYKHGWPFSHSTWILKKNSSVRS